ncbi:SusE domain-containing protein [Flavobacterium sp. HJJ]|uniref:SusE domain-containing protein n=1 Tax=Flavobacterium sp. HJJ TaxID=2783792 RepID=UPI00188ABF61|nr:SusE domain-containing protein [Flavobacterium sp. HJJ]MBF4472879.1 SusE domain-containing protein [Flavobacterium sp. HJJ]
MKKLILLFIALTSLNACSDDNSPIFTAKPDADGIAFTNTFAANYLISQATKDNVADRFMWESADFGVPTNITYELQGATKADFTGFKVVGTTSEKNLAVTVAKLLDFAKDLGLDDNPATTNADGTPNNTGQVYFRLRATAGTAGANETLSEIKVITIKWIETVAAGNSCPSLYAVGEALADIGWNFKPAGEMKCTNNVVQIKAKLTNGNFRFFQESGNWSSALGYSYYKGEGYTIDASLENSLDNDSNFKFVGTPGIYTITIDNTKKTIVLTASSSLWAVGGAVPGGWNFDAAKTIQFTEATPDIWSASITLSNDVFRFFHVFGTWDTKNNFASYSDAGYKINANLVSDGSGDANFKFVGTPGTYKLTINAAAKTITLE